MALPVHLSWGQKVRALAALFITFGFTLGTAETVNFDRVRPNSFPPGWTIQGPGSESLPRWQVAFDRTAPSRPNVLAPSTTRSRRPEASLALFDRGSFQNGEVSVDLKFVAGRLDRSGGVVWRFQDPANYYFAVVSPNKDTVGIYRKVNNEVTLLEPSTVSHPVEQDMWNVLRVVFKGDRFTLYFGHRKLLDVRDSAISAAGKTGVWTKTNTLAYFDNFRLSRHD